MTQEPVYQWGPVHSNPKSNKKWWVIGGLVTALAVFGFGVAAGGTSTESVPSVVTTVTATATSTKTVEVSAAPAPTVTVTEVSSVAQGPSQDCVAALADAEDFRDIAIELSTLMAAHMEQEGKAWVVFESTGDLSVYTGQIEDFTVGVNELTVRVSENTYYDHSIKCLEG